MSKISQYPEATTITDVKLLGNQASVTKQIPATLFEPKTTVKTYKALLTQVGIDAPTDVKLINDIGTSVWEFISHGHYRINNALFIANKTFFSISNTTSESELITISIKWEEAGKIDIYTYKNGSLSDDMLLNTPILIEVYP